MEAAGEPPICPAWESACGAYLGALGTRKRFRCVGCGMDFSYSSGLR